MCTNENKYPNLLKCGIKHLNIKKYKYIALKKGFNYNQGKQIKNSK